MMISRTNPRPADAVRAIMMWPVAATTGAATMREIAESLAADEIGLVPVTAHGSVVGMVSERDLARHLANGANPDHVSAADIMTTDIVEVSPDCEIAAVARLMLDAGVRHLLIRDRDAVAGVVSIRDVLAVLTEAVDDVVPGASANGGATGRMHRRVR